MPIEYAYVPTVDQLSLEETVNRLGFNVVEGGKVVVDATKIISSDHLQLIGHERFAGNALNFESMSIIACMMGSLAQARFEGVDVSGLPAHHGAIDEKAIENILANHSEASGGFALSGAEVRAKALIASDKGWQGITLIAEALGGKGTLPGSEISRILSSVYGSDAEPGCWFGREMPDPSEIVEGKILPTLPWVREIVRQ